MGDLKVDIKELKAFQERLERVANGREKQVFIESCAKELAARLLRKVIRKTPVDTGTLRRSWATQKNGSGSEGLKSKNVSQFVNTLKIHHFGDTYVIEICNDANYASYVEYGHRTKDHKGWVPGHFMLTMSEKEIREVAPRVLEKKIEKWLGGVFR